MPKLNPDVLRWARESAGFGIEGAAHELGVRPERLRMLEAGDEEPSRSVILRMAKHYRRPLIAFYLPAPPDPGPRGQDFRSLPAEERRADEAVLDALLRDIIARQSLLREALEDEEEATPLGFVGSASMADGVVALVSGMRETLGVTVAQFRAARNVDDAFRLLRQAAERAGVYVILASDLGSHHTALDVEVFRGFSLADPVAPFVVVNDRDSRAALAFTLLHELAHLWLGSTGVSGIDPSREIERFCNDVAAEFLLPRRELREFPVSPADTPAILAERVAGFAEERNVSRSMVAFGLYRENRIPRAWWQAMARRYRQEWHESRERQREAGKEGGGPSYFTVRRYRLGALVHTTARLLDAGALTTSKAGKVLGVKPHQVQRLTSGTR